MDTAQYLDVLVAEKDSLDPSYHPNAVRLLTEGKLESSVFWHFSKRSLPLFQQKHASCASPSCENICFVFAVNWTVCCIFYKLNTLVVII